MLFKKHKSQLIKRHFSRSRSGDKDEAIRLFYAYTTSPLEELTHGLSKNPGTSTKHDAKRYGQDLGNIHPQRFRPSCSVPDGFFHVDEYNSHCESLNSTPGARASRHGGGFIVIVPHSSESLDTTDGNKLDCEVFLNPRLLSYVVAITWLSKPQKS